MRWLSMVLSFGLMALLAASCAGPNPLAERFGRAAQVVQIEVTMSDFRFEPAEIALHPGDRVSFVVTNAEGAHTFTIRDRDLDLVFLREGETQATPTLDLTTEAAFQFVCRFHEAIGMVGSIVVGAATAPAPHAPVGQPIPGRIAPAPTSVLERPDQLQELAEIENYTASRFYPARFVALKDLPVRLYITRLHREHVNAFSIAPFVSSTAFVPPGTLGSLDFTPTQSGQFRMVNEGHGFQAEFIVVNSAEEARAERVRLGMQELALIHDFQGGRAIPDRMVVQQGVPVRIYTIGLGGRDRVSIPPFYAPAAVNVQPGQITSIEFTPTQVGEFTVQYERGRLSATVVVEPR